MSKFPDRYKKLSPTLKLQWLTSDCARAMVAANRLQQNQIEAERRRITKDHQRVSPTCPTPAWSDAYRNGEQFPPAADDPACQMVRATQVLHFSEKEVWFPAYYVDQTGKTFEVRMLENDRLMDELDMQNSVGWGMPSRDRTPVFQSTDYAPAINSLLDTSGDRVLPLNQLPLASEDPKVLQQQIHRALVKQAGEQIKLQGCVAAAVNRAKSA